MKREKISLFILVVEIALITLLHSAKTNQPGSQQQLVKKDTNTPVYQLNATTPVTTIK